MKKLSKKGRTLSKAPDPVEMLLDVLRGRTTDDNHLAMIRSDGSGVSANLLYGFEQFHVQKTSRHAGIGPCGSANHLGRLEEEGGRNRQTELLGRFEIDD
jgi:hypothetical protein